MGKLYHLDVGFGDASIILSTSETFLIDCHNIGDYAKLLPTNKRIRGVFITHQHEDHFSGLEYLERNRYTIEHLIYSPYDRRYDDGSVTSEEWEAFNHYKEYFHNKGTKLYPLYRQKGFANPWWATDGVKFWILGPPFAIANKATRELHDACLVVHAGLGKRRCLFTGDASDENLDYIADNTPNMCEDILHASHHGSLNGASLKFIKKCHMQYTVISTKPGVHENVPHPTALQRYEAHTAEKVYRTDRGGTVTWTF